MSRGMVEVTARHGRASATFVVAGTPDDVRERLHVIVREERRFSPEYETEHRVVLMTRITWASWGGLMTITTSPAGRTETLVEVRVTPALAVTAYDWGQGGRDIRRLHERLTRSDG